MKKLLFSYARSYLQYYRTDFQNIISKVLCVSKQLLIPPTIFSLVRVKMSNDSNSVRRRMIDSPGSMSVYKIGASVSEIQGSLSGFLSSE